MVWIGAVMTTLTMDRFGRSDKRGVRGEQSAEGSWPGCQPPLRRRARKANSSSAEGSYDQPLSGAVADRRDPKRVRC